MCGGVSIFSHCERQFSQADNGEDAVLCGLPSSFQNGLHQIKKDF